MATAQEAVPKAPTNADLGRAIRHLRKVRRMSIETLAHAADMHPTYLSGIERGRRNPTWEKVSALADALTVSVRALAQAAEGEAHEAALAEEAGISLGALEPAVRQRRERELSGLVGEPPSRLPRRARRARRYWSSLVNRTAKTVTARAKRTI
jgi:transcriptional regulator with XRE-family HTH domain